MRRRIVLVVGVIAFGLVQYSCSRKNRPQITDKVPLAHVTGVILVDGVPTSGVNIRYVPQGELAEKRERYLNRFFVQSRYEGEFSLSTYVEGDGIPYGEYVLEFTLLEQLFSGEKDKLGGAYSQPNKPFKTIKVEAGRDLDLGRIELSTHDESQKQDRKS